MRVVKIFYVTGGRCMPFFEGMQDLYQILCFIINPIIVCTVLYFLKPKKLWISPIIIMCAFLAISAVFYPYIFIDILTSNYDFTTIYWFIFVVPIEIVSALFFTFMAHFIFKRKSQTKRT